MVCPRDRCLSPQNRVHRYVEYISTGREGGREGRREGGREDREEGVEFEEKRESYIIIGLKLVGPWENLTYLDNYPRPNPNQKPTQVQYMYNKK